MKRYTCDQCEAAMINGTLCHERGCSNQKAKLTFDQALEALSEERHVKSSNVLASALSRKVWVAEWHFIGCMPESSSICLTKKEAVESALIFAETDEGTPRGMKTALLRDGIFQGKAYGGTCNTTISQMTLGELL